LISKAYKIYSQLLYSEARNPYYASRFFSNLMKEHHSNVNATILYKENTQLLEDINKVLEPIKDNTADVVIGSRFLNNSQKIPKYRKAGIKIITELTNITALPIPEAVSTLFDKARKEHIPKKYASKIFSINIALVARLK
jgi:ADP-heptose:LPS heptosyltransferase